jgi:tetratricopeptide (TPR) repeat protein
MVNNLEYLEKKFNEAEKLRNNGNFLEAINIFSKIIKENNNFEPALNNIANCYFQLNEYELAEKYFLKCLKINENNLTSLNNLGLLHLRNKNFKKSLSIFNVSFTKNSNQEKVAEKIVYCLTELNLIKEIDSICKKLIKIFPNNKIILSYNRKNLFKIGKHEEALKAYRKETGVIELNNDDVNLVNYEKNRFIK